MDSSPVRSTDSFHTAKEYSKMWIPWKDEVPRNPRREVVLVTGACGALGQFIVKLLQEEDNDVEEIRVYDNRPFSNKLGFIENKRMSEWLSDVRDPHSLREAMTGVDVVIHCAATTDFRQIDDEKVIHHFNVEGTQHIISVCLEKNVGRLIYASCTAMVCGTEHIFYGTESTTPIPTNFMLGNFAASKWRAETCVLEANGKLCDDGYTVLRTVSLRPTPLYGENDRHFIYHFLKFAVKTGDCHYRIRSLDERLQATYVGNAAWAFLKAKNKLCEDVSISGEAFFITDDTPIIDVNELARPFLEARDLRMSWFTIPYWFAWIIFSLIWYFLTLVNFIVMPVDFDFPSMKVLNFICSTFFFNRSKADLRLDYVPRYTYEEAKERSIEYYKNVSLHMRF